MKELIKVIYNYCSDFVMNLANMTGFSYYEINAILFCYLFPIVLISLIFINVLLSFRLKKLKKKN